MNNYVSLLLEAEAAKRRTSYFNQKGSDRHTIRRQRLSPAKQFLQSKPTSHKLANNSEKTMASTDLFVVGHELHCDRANQAK